MTTNENGNLLLYSGVDSFNHFDIGYVSVERELSETSLFFKKYSQDNPQFQNVIKLYMQEMGTNGLIYIEIFITNDYVGAFKSAYNTQYIAEQANLFQSWFVRYYGPLYVASGTPQTKGSNYSITPYANSSYGTVDHSMTYNINGATVTFKFVLRFYCTLPDIIKNGSGESSAYIYVNESKTVSDVAANNSSTQSYLKLNLCNVKYSTMPNVILTSQTALRSGIKKGGSIDNSFSVSFGYTYGLFTASASFNFNRSSIQQSGTVALPYDNNNKTAARATSSGKMSDDYYMQTQGSQYGIKISYMDVGGTKRSGTVKAEFEYYLNNTYDFNHSGNKTYRASYTLNVG